MPSVVYLLSQTGVTNQRKVAQSGAKDQKWRKGPQNHVKNHTEAFRSISQVPTVPEQSIAYRFVSTFHDNFIYLVVLLIGRIENFRKSKNKKEAQNLPMAQFCKSSSPKS